MSKTRKHRRVTLIIQSGFSPRGESLGFEPPLYGSHVQQAKRYHVGRSWHQTQQFLKLLTVSDRPSLTLLTDVRIDSIRAGDIRACIVVGSPPRPDKWFSVLKKHTFLTLSLNPNSFKWARTASRCRTAIRSDDLIGARVQGRRQESDIDTLCSQSKNDDPQICLWPGSATLTPTPLESTRSDIPEWGAGTRLGLLRSASATREPLGTNNINPLGEKLLQISALSLKGEELQCRLPPRESARPGECRWK